MEQGLSRQASGVEEEEESTGGAIYKTNTVQHWPEYNYPELAGTEARVQENMAAICAAQATAAMWPPMEATGLHPTFLPGVGFMLPPWPPVYPGGLYLGAEAGGNLAGGGSVARGTGPVAQPKASFSVESKGEGQVQVRWVTPARFLNSKDSHPHVSPLFELPLGNSLGSSSSSPSLVNELVPAGAAASTNFKILIRPKVVNTSKGGASFKKAKGRGYVELQCADVLPVEVPEVTFSFAVGRRKHGPVTHCFHSCTVGRLPAGKNEWDLSSQVEDGSITVVLDVALRQ